MFTDHAVLQGCRIPWRRLVLRSIHCCGYDLWLQHWPVAECESVINSDNSSSNLTKLNVTAPLIRLHTAQLSTEGIATHRSRDRATYSDIINSCQHTEYNDDKLFTHSAHQRNAMRQTVYIWHVDIENCQLREGRMCRNKPPKSSTTRIYRKYRISK